MRLAAWYHDAVFEGRPDDEELSARMAEAELAALGAAAEFVAEVARLIRMTAAHNPAAGDRDGEVLSDADLASLAVPREQYRRNSADIRSSTATSPTMTFRSGGPRHRGAAGGTRAVPHAGRAANAGNRRPGPT